MEKNKMRKMTPKTETKNDLNNCLEQLSIQQIEERLEMSALLTSGVLPDYDSGFNEAGACSNDKCFNNDFIKPIAEVPDGSGGDS